MSCATCDHTMQTLYVDKVLKRLWCPRCGSIKNELKREDGTLDVEMDVPMLVKRCRQYEPMLPPNTFGSVWIEFGIAESINPPETRMVRQCGLPPPEATQSTSTTPPSSESTQPTQ